MLTPTGGRGCRVQCAAERSKRGCTRCHHRRTRQRAPSGAGEHPERGRKRANAALDVDHDADVSIQDSWPSVTHTQTYAAALRAAVATYDEPCLLRLLFGAVFCNKARGLDRRGYASPEPWLSHDGLDPLLSAVVEKRRTEAVSRMMAWTMRSTLHRSVRPSWPYP